MITWIRANFKLILLAILIIGASTCAYSVYHMVKSRDAKIASLSVRLLDSEKTVEIQKGLYATKTVEVEGLKAALKGLKSETDEAITFLIAQVEAADQKILTLNQLVVKWKKAYEGAVEASQTEQPGPNPTDPVRKRVDFKKDFGAIGVVGWTLTDPPEGFVKVEQLRPLKLTLAVTKNRDGTWSSLVTSSEENMAVDITLSGIDLSILSRKWYQKLWVDAGIDFYGEKSAGVGISYRGDRYSFGAACHLYELGAGCGLIAGARIFK